MSVKNPLYVVSSQHKTVEPVHSVIDYVLKKLQQILINCLHSLKNLSLVQDLLNAYLDFLSSIRVSFSGSGSR